jgi:hypothetical protein
MTELIAVEPFLTVEAEEFYLDTTFLNFRGG